MVILQGEFGLGGHRGGNSGGTCFKLPEFTFGSQRRDVGEGAGGGSVFYGMAPGRKASYLKLQEPLAISDRNNSF